MTERARRLPEERGNLRPERPEGGSGSGGGGQAFLDSPRAQAVRAKEFDRLAAEVARLVAALELPASDVRREVRRAPDRCIVQLGPVALTISWVRGSSELVTDGRLLVIEWLGIVARGRTRIPERLESKVNAPAEALPAAIQQESVLLVVATGADDWLWQPEGSRLAGLTSIDLAASTVESLRQRVDRIPRPA
jgi:hypothetical protein